MNHAKWNKITRVYIAGKSEVKWSIYLLVLTSPDFLKRQNSNVIYKVRF